MRSISLSHAHSIWTSIIATITQRWGLKFKSLTEDLTYVVILFFQGFLDSLSFNAIFDSIIHNEAIRKAVLNCMGLNLLSYTCGIALYFIFELLVQSITYSWLHWLHLSCDHTQIVQQWNKMFFTCTRVMFDMFWLVLVYGFGFLVSSRWYAMIAENLSDSYIVTATTASVAVKRHGSASYNIASRIGKGHNGKGFVLTVSDEILYFTRMAAFISTNFLLGFIPYVGYYLALLFNCWHVSFYSFEATWRRRNQYKSASTYLLWQEHDWAYFAGFGAPLTILSTLFSSVTSLFITSAIYPALIIMAARPEAGAWQRGHKPRYGYKILPQAIHYFEIARNTADFFASQLNRYLNAPTTSSTAK